MHIYRNAMEAGRPILSKLLQAAMIVIGGLLMAKVVLMGSTYFVIAGVLAVILGILLIRNLQLGLLLYLFIAALGFGESPGVQSPHSEYRAGLMPSQVLLGFLALLWIGRAWLTDGFKIVKSEVNLPLVLLAVVAVVSLIFSNVLRSTRELLFHQLLITQIAEVGLLAFSICAFFLAANTFRERKYIRLIFVPIVLLGYYYSAYRIFEFEFPVPMVWGSFLVAAALAMIYARLLFDKLDRWHMIGLILLTTPLIYASFKDLAWVSGWIATAVAITVVSYYRSKGLAAAFILLGLFMLFVYPGVYGDIHRESEEGSNFDRFIIWEDSIRMFMQANPVLGIGPGNYHPYVYYHGTIWFGGGTYTTAHNNYVQIAAEMGLVGLAVFLWVIIAGLVAGHRGARYGPPDMKWMPVAASAVLAGVAVASMFGDYLFPSRGNHGLVHFGTTVYTWLILGAAVAVSHLPRKDKHEDEDSSQHEPADSISEGADRVYS